MTRSIKVSPRASAFACVRILRRSIIRSRSASDSMLNHVRSCWKCFTSSRGVVAIGNGLHWESNKCVHFAHPIVSFQNHFTQPVPWWSHALCFTGPGGRHVECAYYFDFCRLCRFSVGERVLWLTQAHVRMQSSGQDPRPGWDWANATSVSTLSRSATSFRVFSRVGGMHSLSSEFFEIAP